MTSSAASGGSQECPRRSSEPPWRLGKLCEAGVTWVVRGNAAGTGAPELLSFNGKEGLAAPMSGEASWVTEAPNPLTCGRSSPDSFVPAGGLYPLSSRRRPDAGPPSASCHSSPASDAACARQTRAGFRKSPGHSDTILSLPLAQNPHLVWQH